MATKPKLVLIYLVMALAFNLSGCGFAQANADQACTAYKNNDLKTSVEVFASLGRKNPAYLKQLEQVASIIDYQEAMKAYRENQAENERKRAQGYKGVYFIAGEPNGEAAYKATKALDLFCS